MLANATGSTSAAKGTENMNLLKVVNNKIIEDQEHKKFGQNINSQKKFAGKILNYNIISVAYCKKYQLFFFKNSFKNGIEIENIYKH